MSAVVEQLDIFEAMRRRTAGQDLVIARADTDYRERLTAAIKVLAASAEAFCSDNIRSVAGNPPCNPNLIGAVVQGAMKHGLIKQVGWTRSSRIIGHGNRVGLYVGTEVNWP
jgi:hypothetical protein